MFQLSHSDTYTLQTLSKRTTRTIYLSALLMDICRKDLKKLPFHKPEQSETVDRDSDFITLFTCFLIRTQKSSVSSYDVVLHPQTLRRLQDLHDSLSSGSEEEVVDLFHLFLYSLLANPSLDFLADEWKDPFRLFLIAVHLQDDHGTFSRTPLIPPTISKAQWGFRATCAEEVKIRKEEFQGNCFKCVLNSIP